MKSGERLDMMSSRAFEIAGHSIFVTGLSTLIGQDGIGEPIAECVSVTPSGRRPKDMCDIKIRKLAAKAYMARHQVVSDFIESASNNGESNAA